jgi:ABC-type ATPase involved in cell division
VIIADEPTGSLDRQWADSVIGLLHDVTVNGTALLLARHDEHLIESRPPDYPAGLRRHGRRRNDTTPTGT